jgi:hypothetical protein
MFQKFKFAPGDLVEDNHPCECPLDHSDFVKEEHFTRIFRVEEVFLDEGHECITLVNFNEGSYYCSGTFRHMRTSTESIEDMIKANKPVRETVHG